MALKITKELILPESGTIEIDLTLPIDKYVVTGNPTLSANVTITTIGTAVEGHSIEIVYIATPTIGINTITILGQNINNIATKPIIFNASYINSQWRVVYTNYNSVDPTATPLGTQNIENGAITPDKIAREAVSIPQLNPNVLSTPITYLYDSNTIGKNRFVSFFIPHKFQLTAIAVCSLEAMATEALNYSVSIINSTPVYTASVDTSVAAGSLYVVPMDDTAPFKSTTGGYLRFTPTKTTTGGAVLFTFVIKRIE